MRHGYETLRPMPLFLGHRTAELVLNKADIELPCPSIGQELEHCWASRSELERLDLSALEGIPMPYDILVSSPDELRRWEGVRCHLSRTHLPSSSFIELSPDVFVAAPALCLIQRSDTLTLAQSIAFADRLCGSYSLDPRRASGIVERVPLTTCEELQEYISRCRGIRGIEQARRAVSLAENNSASPMETISRLVFCLPRRLGGFGLSSPAMNFEKTLTQAAQKLTGKGFIRIDLYWEDYMFGIEYQGKYAHSSVTKIAADIARQLAAEQMGIELQPITIEQIRNQAQRIAIANKIASRIGETIAADDAFMQANQKLVNELLLTMGT